MRESKRTEPLNKFEKSLTLELLIDGLLALIRKKFTNPRVDS